jgi:hypothetical protein
MKLGTLDAVLVKRLILDLSTADIFLQPDKFFETTLLYYRSLPSAASARDFAAVRGKCRR